MTTPATVPRPVSADWFRADVVLGSDYHGALARMRRSQPVQHLLPFADGSRLGMYALYRHDDVARVLRDQATFTLDVVRQRYSAVLGRRTMVSLDSDERRSYRSALAGLLGPGRLAELVATGVVPAVDDLLDGLAGPAPVDLATAYASQLPALVLTRILGLRPDVAAYLAELSSAVAAFMDRPVPGARAARSLRRLLQEAVTDCRRSPRPGVIAELCRAEVAGAPLDDDDLVSLLTLLVWAGTETAGPALSNILYALLVHPDQLRRLGDEPDLVSAVVEEGLRWETPVQWTCRTVAAPAEVQGTRLPPGSLVLAHLGSANRDEERYPNASRFDPSRSPADHFAFGHGPHHCIGSHLGRAELQVGLRSLLARFPDIALDGERPAMTGQLVRTPSHLRVRFGRPAP